MEQRSPQPIRISCTVVYVPSCKSAAWVGLFTVRLSPLVFFVAPLTYPAPSGHFFYKNDNQESDIEILTATLGEGAHYTNQRLVAGDQATTATKPMPQDGTTTMHEYRLDWLQDRTDFYLNGKLQQTFTQNVPNTAGAWLWNNWSNGDHTWSAGPPAEDNVMKIEKIEMYYNRTGSAGTCT